MRVLQAVFIFLKLNWAPSLFYLAIIPSGCLGSHEIRLYHTFDSLSWWSILIPTYFIAGSEILSVVLARLTIKLEG
jgi:hypothetical protein